MKLYVMRHSYTKLNETSKIQGRVDEPLSTNGIKHAHEILSQMKDVSVDRIASSPLLRATQTAIIAAHYLKYNKPIVMVQQLIERDFGVLEHMSIEKAKPIFSKSEDIEGYEKNAFFEKRIAQGINILKTNYSNHHVLLFCHSHVIKAILKLSTFENLDYIQTSIDHQTLTVFEVFDNKIEFIEFIKKGKS